MERRRFFGQFLVERGVITEDQLRAAVQYQTTRNSRIGALGIEEGVLRTSDLERIDKEQRGSDERFGEIAMRFAILNGARLEALLAKQKERHVHLGAALVATQSITPEQLADELAAHHLEEEQSKDELERSHEQLSKIAGDLHPIAVETTQRLLLRLADVLTKTASPRTETGPDWKPDVSVSMRARGGWSGVYRLCLSSNIARRIAFRLAGSTASPEVINHALSEFVSLVGSAISRSLASRNVTCTFSAPQGPSDKGADQNRPDKTVTYPLDVVFPDSGVGQVQVVVVREA